MANPVVILSPGRVFVNGMSRSLHMEYPNVWYHVMMPREMWGFFSSRTAREKIFLITHETQLKSTAGAGGPFSRVSCGLDGHSQAPRDGFMAYREKGAPVPDKLLRIECNQKDFLTFSGVLRIPVQ